LTKELGASLEAGPPDPSIFSTESSDSGQLNLLKPALASQSLAVSGMAGFLGK
jgi:hypothetical protein